MVPGRAEPVNVMLATVVPVQTTWPNGINTVGVGFTVMVKVLACPWQLPPTVMYCGVTVMLAMMGRPVALAALKAGILPVPDAARPMAVLSFVQVKPMPVAAVNAPMVAADPLQNVLLAGWLMVGIGFTTML